MNLLYFRLAKYLDQAAWYTLLAAIAIMPWVLDNRLSEPFTMAKGYTLAGMVLVALILWISKAVLLRKLDIYKTKLDGLLLALLGATALATIFSTNRLDSFFGHSDFFGGSTITTFFLITFFFLFIQYCRTIQQWRQTIDLVVTLGLLSTVPLLAAAFGQPILTSWLQGHWNPVAANNSVFAVWLMTIFLMAASQLLRKRLPVWRLALYSVAAVVTFITLVILNYTIVWWLLAGGLLLLLLIGTSFLREARLPWISGLFACLVLVAIFIGLSTPRLAPHTAPAEVGLNNQASTLLVRRALFASTKNTIIGNGPGTFGTVFSNFRDVSFNTDPSAWSLRFLQPYSTVLALLAEGGLVTFLTWVLVVIFVIGLGLAGTKRARAELARQSVVQFFDKDQSQTERYYVEAATLIVPWLVLSIAMGFVFFEMSLWFMWIVTLALFTAGLAHIYHR